MPVSFFLYPNTGNSTAYIARLLFYLSFITLLLYSISVLLKFIIPFPTSFSLESLASFGTSPSKCLVYGAGCHQVFLAFLQGLSWFFPGKLLIGFPDLKRIISSWEQYRTKGWEFNSQCFNSSIWICIPLFFFVGNIIVTIVCYSHLY